MKNNIYYSEGSDDETINMQRKKKVKQNSIINKPITVNL